MAETDKRDRLSCWSWTDWLADECVEASAGRCIGAAANHLEAESSPPGFCFGNENVPSLGMIQ